MRFLHLADLHLGKRVNGFDLLDDQRFILEQVVDLCAGRSVDAVVVAGGHLRRAPAARRRRAAAGLVF